MPNLNHCPDCGDFYTDASSHAVWCRIELGLGEPTVEDEIDALVLRTTDPETVDYEREAAELSLAIMRHEPLIEEEVAA